MAFTDDRIAFPSRHTGFIINNGWAFINADAVGDTPPAILFPIGGRVNFMILIRSD